MDPARRTVSWQCAKTLFVGIAQFFGRDLRVKGSSVLVPLLVPPRTDLIVAVVTFSQFMVSIMPPFLECSRKIFRPLTSLFNVDDGANRGNIRIPTELLRKGIYAGAVLFCLQEIWPRPFWRNVVEPAISSVLKVTLHPACDALTMAALGGWAFWYIWPRRNDPWGDGRRLGQ
eukprot:GEMP01083220.1.p1 GENE.GEMP01083220.1~~GEMP01083220.1.p1  ORF type:complete len:184 (+),score=12.98 GEMP01083220.1:36-554(+)